MSYPARGWIVRFGVCMCWCVTFAQVVIHTRVTKQTRTTLSLDAALQWVKGQEMTAWDIISYNDWRRLEYNNEQRVDNYEHKKKQNKSWKEKGDRGTGEQKETKSGGFTSYDIEDSNDNMRHKWGEVRTLASTTLPYASLLIFSAPSIPVVGFITLILQWFRRWRRSKDKWSLSIVKQAHACINCLLPLAFFFMFSWSRARASACCSTYT